MERKNVILFNSLWRRYSLIDLMRWLIKKEIKEVCSVGNNILTSGTQYKFPETVCSILKFEDGATGKI